MHKVKYENAPSGWNEALPLGNGQFGGMMFFEDNKLTMAMNHYEVYYRKLQRYSQAYREEEGRANRHRYGRTYEELKQRTQEIYRDPDKGSFYLYGDALSDNNMYRRYGKSSGGSSHYPTGEIVLHPAAGLAEPANYVLQLDVEQACVRLQIEKGEAKLEVRTIVAQEGDILVSEIRQTSPSLLEAVTLSIPSRRYVEMDVDYRQVDEATFCYLGSFYPDGEDRDAYGPFSFLVMTKIVGAKGMAERSADSIRICLSEAEHSVTLLTTVVTEEDNEDLLHFALQRLNKATLQTEQLKESHRVYWSRFWEQSSITLPDKMIEDLWYVNLYAIACCSGKGGRMYEQACGLNGLWDIKQPTKWGSMWYWDVNIQAAFWPLYTANHLDIAEAFQDALLSYTKEAERMAKEFYGLDGIAGDYPHALYFSIWPWCAQFLWDYYQYSMDQSFLREKAYPLFKSILRFFEGYLQADGDSGLYGLFPDISPEQGPLSRNSVSSLSTVKYLLRMAIEANALLGEAEEDRRRWSEMEERLAPYPTADSKRYGTVLRDSEWAPADIHLRHPSLLMPIYPIGEISKHSGPELRKLAENTLRYAENNTEYGVFQFGWLSCAASRLGNGNTALRLLYEQGIDLSLRSNGLFSEETERWMNYCNITNEPLYHPNMMESSGEMVAAVNEMLLQSYSGAIEVFPAIPSGEAERERSVGLYEHEVGNKIRPYSKWEDCSFRNLLAAGAFEVSAARKDGRTAWVKLKSKGGNHAIIINPFTPDVEPAVAQLVGNEWIRILYQQEKERLSFDTEKGDEYVVYSASTTASDLLIVLSGQNDAAVTDGGYPRVHEAHTSRRVFLGKNRDTQHYQLVDHFTFDYYAGNYRESRLAAYRLDCGVAAETLVKDYYKALPRQLHMDGIIGQSFRKITPQMAFTPYAGIGWVNHGVLVAEDRGAADELRRDFIGGTDEATLLIELPRGRYDLLFVSGDYAASSYTEIEIEGQSIWKPERPLRAGEFATDILPITQRKDGFAAIRFRTCDSLQWRVNMLIINKNYTYL